MLKITVELLPYGREEGKRLLGAMLIANDGTGTPEVGNYVATMHSEYTGKKPRVARLRNFKRRKQSCWSLVGGFLKHFGHTPRSPARGDDWHVEEASDAD